MSFVKEQPGHHALRKIFAERTTPVIAWVGAGLSAPAGLPSWKGLTDALITAGRNKVATITGPGAAQLKGLLTVILEKARAHDYWLCFQLLEQLLGPTTYSSEIRANLSLGTSAPVPKAYELLWKLNLAGMVSLNLDPLANRAYSKVNPGGDIERFSGFQTKNLMGVLQKNKLFIANVHGALEDSTTWVFTAPKLKSLLQDAGYRQFINTCITSRTILFVGITVDDRAVSEHFETLSNAGITGIQHFWITDRNDAATDAWAEKLNISIIRYDSSSGSHAQLEECLKDLGSNIPSKEEDSQPVVIERIDVDTNLLPPEELVTKPLEFMRSQLNSKALEILRKQDSSAYAAYDRFCTDYDEVIDRAWYVSTTAPKNVLLGYTLNRQVASGSFGVVFDATSPDGERVAVKVLRRDVRTDSSMLQTFRRGVRSMKILRDRKVPGMVGFIDASEIPALVVMEWIDGPDLSTLVKSQLAKDWFTLIRIAHDLSKVIFQAHQLPERVLHRDIRPPNVMLRNYWSQDEDFEVVVTDFDLSWHVESLELSVIAKPLGFMAPEQLHRREGRGGASTRSALVDSFGFGMTLYYLLTGDIPVPDQQKHADWQASLRNRIASRSYPGWKCLPTRMARLVHGSTLDEQASRWDFSKIVGELSILRKIVEDDFSAVTVDYIAEEIANHTETIAQYHWDDDRGTAIYDLAGTHIELHGNIPTGTIQLTMEWRQTGAENWKARFKSTSDVRDRISGILEHGGWKNVQNEGSVGFTRVTAICTPEGIHGEAQKLAKAVDGIAHALRPKS